MRLPSAKRFGTVIADTDFTNNSLYIRMPHVPNRSNCVEAFNLKLMIWE